MTLSVRTAWVSLALVATLASQDASAQLFAYVKTDSDVTVGLDETTRRLIQGLPDEVKKQVLDLLRQALPLIDTSVEKYLNRVDEIVSNQVNHLQCAGQGFAKGTVEEVSAAIKGRPPTPLLTLQKQFEDRESAFESRPLIHLAIEYEDFLGRAAVTACQVVSEKTNTDRVASLQAKARPRWRIWYDLEDKCDSPQACLNLRYSHLKELIERSEQRDIERSSVRKTFASVNQKPATSDNMFSRLTRKKTSSGPWIVFETELLKIAEAERALVAVRDLRQTNARNAFNAGTDLLIAAEATEKTASNAVHSTDLASNQRAVALAAQGLANVDEIRRLVNLGGANSLEVQAKVPDALSRLAALKSAAEATSTSANANIKTIQARNAEAEEEYRRKKAEADQRRQDKQPR